MGSKKHVVDLDLLIKGVISEKAVSSKEFKDSLGPSDVSRVWWMSTGRVIFSLIRLNLFVKKLMK